MGRVQADNWLWVICCCGCLPIIGLVKGLICAGPVALIYMLGCTFTAIIMLPHDIYYTYYTILSTKKIGPNLTILGLLLLPIPLLIWPVLVLLCSTISGFSVGLFSPIADTFNDRYELFCGGITNAFERAFTHVKDFWRFNANSYFSYLAEIRDYKLGIGEKPFDISIIQLIVGTIVGTTGSIFDGICFSFIAVIYFIPMLFTGYSKLWKQFCDYISRFKAHCLEFVWFCILFPSFILANALMPGLVAILSCIIIIAGLFMGLSSAVKAYEDGIPAAFEFMWDNVVKANNEVRKAVC